MATVAACPKCGSKGVGLQETHGALACGECDWAASTEELMEL